MMFDKIKSRLTALPPIAGDAIGGLSLMIMLIAGLHLPGTF